MRQNFKNYRMGLPKILKKILPENWVYNYEIKIQKISMQNEMSFDDWEKKGKPLPPPSSLKRAMMLESAKRYNATQFVETGTFLGDTSFFMKDYFDKVDTIELDTKLADKAVKRFENIENVKVWQGDSGIVILEILKTINKNSVVFFYLDGHFSGGITAKANLNTPISKELELIFNHSKNHVVFIDDARLFFSDEKDYPPYDELVKQIKMYNPKADISIDLDIIKILSNT